jgi:bacterioferritin-associated ferredoxin
MIGKVDRCICYQAPFAAIRAKSQAKGWTTLQEVCQGTAAGTGCGSCRRYLQAILDTGADTFHVALGNDPPRPWSPALHP